MEIGIVVWAVALCVTGWYGSRALLRWVLSGIDWNREQFGLAEYIVYCLVLPSTFSAVLGVLACTLLFPHFSSQQHLAQVFLSTLSWAINILGSNWAIHLRVKQVFGLPQKLSQLP